MNNVKTFKYVEGILNKWKSCGYNTLEEIKEKEVKKNQIDNNGIKELFDYDWLNDNGETNE